MNSKYYDPVVAQLVDVYGVKQLLEDFNLEKIQNAGEYFMARCPFHENKKEPDFQMHKRYFIWNCFGCCEQGNVYQFIARIANVSMKEAGLYIQKLAGFDADTNIEDIKFRAKLKALFFDMNDDDEDVKVIPTFSKQALDLMNTGPDPYQYLKGRGYSNEAIEYFECSFTDKWQGYDREKEEYRYEQRVVIPGHLDDGGLCGFIGRTVVNDEPKYKYTKGYPKSRSLFNLHRIKNKLDRGLILVEGSLDSMRIHDFETPNVAGIYGASLSIHQVKLICKYTDKVFLMFDNDNAGRMATKKSVELLKDLIDVNIVPLGTRKDPGEIESKEELNYCLNNSLNWFQFNSLQGFKNRKVV